MNDAPQQPTPASGTVRKSLLAGAAVIAVLAGTIGLANAANSTSTAQDGTAAPAQTAPYAMPAADGGTGKPCDDFGGRGPDGAPSGGSTTPATPDAGGTSGTSMPEV